jgi:hypothetical protein
MSRRAREWSKVATQESAGLHFGIRVLIPIEFGDLVQDLVYSTVQILRSVSSRGTPHAQYIYPAYGHILGSDPGSKTVSVLFSRMQNPPGRVGEYRYVKSRNTSQVLCVEGGGSAARVKVHWHELGTSSFQRNGDVPLHV